MRSSLGRILAVLSFAGCAFAYEYDASGVRTATMVIKGLFALVFIGLTGLAIPVLAMARGHRVPYIPLLIALILSIFQCLSSFAYDMLIANVDFSDDIPGEAYSATLGISALFYYWGLALVFMAFVNLIKVRVDKILPPSEGQGLNFVWTIGCLATSFIIFIFATVTGALYIDFIRHAFSPSDISIRDIITKYDNYQNLHYVFSAMFYAGSIYLGALAFFAYNRAHRAGINDTVLKILLFVAFPIHALHIVQNFVFVILWSPSGLDLDPGSRSVQENAALADTLLDSLLHAATITVLLIAGLRRSNWLTPAELNNAPKVQYPSYATYPVQTVYPAQAAYPAQGYQTQSQYVDNTKIYQQQ